MEVSLIGILVQQCLWWFALVHLVAFRGGSSVRGM